MNGRLLFVVLLIGLPAAPNVSMAEDTKDGWSAWTASFGLQMWRPMYAVGEQSVEVADKPTIGGVVKVNHALNDTFGMHVRGTFGVHSAEVPDRESSGDAWAAGLGLDFHHALSNKVLWSNTFGLAYGKSSAEFNKVSGPELTSVGAYFITTFDVTVWGNMGIWMDWGCQVVGPSFADTDAGDVNVWHINPLGAGGMRISF